MSKKISVVLFLLCAQMGAQGQQFSRFNKISGTGETHSELAVLDPGFVTIVQDFYNWNTLGGGREYDTAHYDFSDFVYNEGDNLVKEPDFSDYLLTQPIILTSFQ